VRRTIAGGFLFAAALALGAVLYATSEKAVTLQRVDVTRLPAVDVYLTVTDSKGDSVLGLTELEVSVAIDGAPQKITSLTSALAGGESLAVVLLFDRSGSMKTAQDGIRDAGVQFLRRLSRDDQMAVVSFDDKVRVDGRLSTDRGALETAIKAIAPGRDTALYDAIQTALDLLKDVRTKRQAILVLSDGKDTRSRARAADVLAEAKKRGVPVFSVALGDAVDKGSLDRLAHETGGDALTATRPEQLRLLYQKIAERLQNQYVVSFNSTYGEDGAWHTLAIDVKDAATKTATARREFIATKGIGVSPDLIRGFERRAEQRDWAGLVGVGGVTGMVFGFVLAVAIRRIRPDVSLRSPLAVGVVILSGLVGGIIAAVARIVAM
jgi:VWFA-related protein